MIGRKKWSRRPAESDRHDDRMGTDAIIVKELDHRFRGEGGRGTGIDGCKCPVENRGKRRGENNHSPRELYEPI
jgi:hypothetical protein